MGEPKAKRTREEIKARRASSSGPPNSSFRTRCTARSAANLNVTWASWSLAYFVFICDECVEMCNDVIAGRPIAGKGYQKPLERSTDQLLPLMGSVNFAADASRDFLQQVVDTLRSREVSWADIGAHLGVSRQSAWERFS